MINRATSTPAIGPITSAGFHLRVDGGLNGGRGGIGRGAGGHMGAWGGRGARGCVSGAGGGFSGVPASAGGGCSGPAKSNNEADCGNGVAAGITGGSGGAPRAGDTVS